MFLHFLSRSRSFCPRTFHFLASLDPDCEGTVMLYIISHCLPVDMVSYPRRLESLHVFMSLKLVMFVWTAITTLNLPFASSDIMALSEFVSVYKWREGVLCGFCCIETVNDNPLMNGIFTVRTVFLQFEYRGIPQDICLHFISKQ